MISSDALQVVQVVLGIVLGSKSGCEKPLEEICQNQLRTGSHILVET